MKSNDLNYFLDQILPLEWYLFLHMHHDHLIIDIVCGVNACPCVSVYVCVCVCSFKFNQIKRKQHGLVRLWSPVTDTNDTDSLAKPGK